MTKITAFIPARGGSKGIPKKNIVDFCGKPLIAWTIEFSLKLKIFDSVVVSTDHEEIAEIAKKYGANVSMRPTHLATDHTTALEVIQYAFESNISKDTIAYLQPTTPFRSPTHIHEALSLIDLYDSVVSVMEVPHRMTPESLMQRDGASLSFLVPSEKQQFQRQNKPIYVARNGPSLLITKRETVMTKKSLYGDKIGGVMMDFLYSIDIDHTEDLTIARVLCPLFLESEKV